MFFKIAGIVAGSSYAHVDIVSRVVRSFGYRAMWDVRRETYNKRD